MMHPISFEEELFFQNHPAAASLYELFVEKLFARFPATSIRVQKTQITFSNRLSDACVSFLRVK